MTALEKLTKKTSSRLHICVGLDTDVKKIPSFLQKSNEPVYLFNKSIIEETKNYAAAYKLNLAFYEAEGIDGLRALEKTLSEIPSDIPVIGDAKRGDIGNTARMYAQALFEEFSFDASTLNPLLGKDSLEPFFEYRDKLHFILALTSNPGAEDFEKLTLANGGPFYQEIIRKTKTWAPNIGFVFGATKTSELSENFDLLADVPVLLPGVGAQGGSLEEIAEMFYSHNAENFLINISRGLIYLDTSENFAYFTKERLKQLNETVKFIAEKNAEANQ